jgi:hypothetical protein
VFGHKEDEARRANILKEKQEKSKKVFLLPVRILEFHPTSD